jgi:adenylate cyclase
VSDPPATPDPSLNTLYAAVGIEPPTLRRGDIAARTGIDPEQSLRWWRAMGFAEVGDDEVAFSQADLDQALRLRDLLDQGIIQDGDILRLARLMGASFSRLVDAQLNAVINRLPTNASTVLADGSEHDVVSFMESTMNFVWRRHLLAALAQSLNAGETDAQQAVGFADLSGFSRVSKTGTPEHITEIVETFESMAFDVVSAHEGRVVKLIGDEVMYVAKTVDDAVAIALDLIVRLAPIEAVPPVHCGVAFGETVRVGGDVFGPTVNLASRLTGLARPDSVVVPRADGIHLLDREDLDARWVRRPYDLRGIGRTRIISIRPLTEEGDTSDD